MAPGLLDWLERPSRTRGIHFADSADGWDFRSYAGLARQVRQVAAGLAEHGVTGGDRVAILARTGPHLVTSLFGAMLAGAAPTLLPPPRALQDGGRHLRDTSSLLHSAQPSCVVVDDELRGGLSDVFPLPDVSEPTPFSALTSTGEDGTGEDGTGEDGGARGPAEHALVQFTSGSSGTARGVLLPAAAAAANVAAIGRWLRIAPDDATASWLPVHHDMGLVGGLLTPVVHGIDLRLMRPEQFLRRPLRFLRCFSEHRATLTAMPVFGLDHLTRRLAASDLDGMDLSSWRAVIVGAERIRPGSLENFERLCAPAGFSRRAILPAYGLAEATLAVTALPLEEEWNACVTGPQPGALDVLWRERAPLVGCGRDLPGVRTSIVDGDGTPVPPGAVGEIVVRGESLAAGYLGHAPDEHRAHTRLVDGALHTGDAGFTANGQLHVLGRLGDSVKVRGRTLFAEDVELALASPGLPAERYAVVLGERNEAPVVVAVLERVDPQVRASVEQILRGAGEGADVLIADVGRGAIPRTTSGKPKRRRLWLRFLAGELPTAPCGSAAEDVEGTRRQRRPRQGRADQ